jgi:MarC family membrane protein
MTIVSAALLLFLVMDPLGNIPFFLTGLKYVDPARQRRVIVRELLIALGALGIFLFAGRYLLQLLHVSEPALTLAGGVILLLIALRMIFPAGERPLHEDVEGEPFIVPLAIPYVAGPSALATEILLMSREPERWPEWLAALLLAWFATAVIILAGSALRRYLGQKGLIAMERLMGMVLITVAVQMMLNGVRAALAELAPAGRVASALVGAPLEQFRVGRPGPLREGRPVDPVAVGELVDLGRRGEPLLHTLGSDGSQLLDFLGLE